MGLMMIWDAKYSWKMRKPALMEEVRSVLQKTLIMLTKCSQRNVESWWIETQVYEGKV